MGRYTAESAPAIKDADGDMLSFRELKICLECGKSCDITVHPCPYCKSSSHTRTMLFIHLSSKERGGCQWPIVKVMNFGNHE